MIKIGSHVRHQAYGIGRVLQLDWSSPQPKAFVNFGFASYWIVIATLTLVPSNDEPTAPPPAVGNPPSTPLHSNGQGVAPVLSSDATEARKGIAALRLGQVRRGDVVDLSVGLETLQESCQKTLADAAKGVPNAILIEGSWGGGKTHALTLLRAYARQNNFAITKTVLDGQDACFWDPYRLFGEMLRRLEMPGVESERGLVPHLLKAKAKAKESVADLRLIGAYDVANTIASISSDAFADIEVAHAIESYLTYELPVSQVRSALRMHGVVCPTLGALLPKYKHEKMAAFGSVVTLWVKILKTWGASGVVLVFDELDVEYAVTAKDTQVNEKRRADRHTVLEALRGVLSVNVPVVMAFAAAPAPPGIATYADACEDIADVFHGKVWRHQAVSPSKQQLAELFARVVALYRRAYPEDALQFADNEQDVLLERLYALYVREPRPVPRQYIRTVVELCDLIATRQATVVGLLKHLEAHL